MTVSDAETTTAHAPRAEGMLFPLGIASLLLGMLFVFFWVLMGIGLDGDAPDAEASGVITRRWVLVSIGSFLSFQGIVLLVEMQQPLGHGPDGENIFWAGRGTGKG